VSKGKLVASKRDNLKITDIYYISIKKSLIISRWKSWKWKIVVSRFTIRRDE
jgi:hypothetical protein